MHNINKQILQITNMKNLLKTRLLSITSYNIISDKIYFNLIFNIFRVFFREFDGEIISSSNP